MRPLFLFLICLMIFQVTSTGQSNSGEEQVSIFHIQDAIIDTLITIPKFSPGYDFNRSSDIPSLPGISRKFLPGDQGILKRFPQIRDFEDIEREQHYPGSSRFYAKRPYLRNIPGSHRFNIKPDSTVKYYLIIKDPIRHTVTK